MYQFLFKANKNQTKTNKSNQ